MSIVNRRAEDKAIGFFCLLDEFVADIVIKDAAILGAFIAADTIPDRFHSDLKDFGFDFFLFKLFADFI